MDAPKLVHSGIPARECQVVLTSPPNYTRDSPSNDQCFACLIVIGQATANIVQSGSISIHCVRMAF